MAKPRTRKMVNLSIEETSGVDHPAHLHEGWLVMKSASESEVQRVLDKSLDGRYKIYLGGWNDNNPVYDDYERMLSCRGLNKNYGRIQAADIYSYVGGYNFINATIAPLRDTKFNRLKSELKVVEAGWMGYDDKHHPNVSYSNSTRYFT